jgi:hypothetical protein
MKTLAGEAAKLLVSFSTESADSRLIDHCRLLGCSIFSLHSGDNSLSCFLRHRMILPCPGFMSLQSFSSSALHAWTKSWNFSFIIFRSSLQAGDSSFECSLRHCTRRPCPGCTPLQKLETSSAQGFAFGSAQAGDAMDKQNAAASVAIFQFFICQLLLSDFKNNRKLSCRPPFSFSDPDSRILFGNH